MLLEQSQLYEHVYVTLDILFEKLMVNEVCYPKNPVKSLSIVCNSLINVFAKTESKPV